MKQETVVNSEQAQGDHGVGAAIGALMVLMGAIFLMGTSGITIAGRSPSMLIGLVPVLWIGLSAYRRYQQDGRLTRRVVGIAVFAALPLAYMAAMALGYSVSGLWPLGLIAVGVAFILFRGSK
jgi:hypothetical protein